MKNFIYGCMSGAACLTLLLGYYYKPPPRATYTDYIEAIAINRDDNHYRGVVPIPERKPEYGYTQEARTEMNYLFSMIR